MNDVTRILHQVEVGDPSAAGQLLPLVYEELRRLAAQKMAGESPDHTLQATALVHEAYIRLVDIEQASHWNSRGHFFSAAAEAMRRILVERARRKSGPAAGGEHHRVEFALAEALMPNFSGDFLALHTALEGLEVADPRAAELIKLRYFAGLTRDQAAEVLGISVATADNDWAYAKGWLQVALMRDDASRPNS